MGTCAGADGKCRPEPYKIVGKRVKFINARYKDQSMSTVWSSHIVLLEPPGSAAGLWNIWQIPGPSGAFLVSNEVYPDWYLTTDILGRNPPPPPRVTAYNVLDPSVPRLAVKIQAAPDESGNVMISSFHDEIHFYYARWPGHALGTFKNDPGTAGYWTLDPPLRGLMKELRPYYGTRCAWDCGNAEGQFSVSSLALLAVVLVADTAL